MDVKRGISGYLIASLLLHLIAHSDMLSLCPWPLIESGVPQGTLVPLSLREQFEPHTVGVVQRGHGPLPWVAERFVHHLMEQVHACRHSPRHPVRRRHTTRPGAGPAP